MKHYDYVVIGSGLSAYAAVKELLSKKKNFAVLDIGQKIEKNILDIYQKKSWNHIKQNKNHVLKNLNTLQSKTKLKLSYGSDHSYFYSKNIEHLKLPKLDMLVSKSLGGFSNNWGGVLYLYNSDELKNWPITKNKFYQDLDEVGKNFKIDKQLIKELTDNDQEIKKNSKYFKDAIIALNNCKSRGMCMYGCPENSILNAKNFFNELINKKKINYFSNLKLNKIRKNDQLELECIEINDLKKINFSAEKVFLAAGPVSTTHIILNSFEEIQQLRVKDSSMFVFPIINLKKQHRTHGKQMCTKIFKYHKDKNNFLIQIYDEIDFFLYKFPSVIKKIFNKYLKLSIGIGYLESKDSSELVLEKRNNKIFYKTKKNFNYFKRIFYLFLFCFNTIKKGIISFPFLQYKLDDFSSYHLGASIPMTNASKNNLKVYTDTKGRLNLNDKIIILDSSNFTNIQPGSISLMSMINSQRITKANLK